MTLKYVLIVTVFFIQIFVKSIDTATSKPGDTKSDNATTATTSQETTTPPTATDTTINPTPSSSTITQVSTTTTTTEAPRLPELGETCTNATDCEGSIDGEVVCADNKCKCNDGDQHFEYNKTTCLEGSNLIPSITVDSSTTILKVSWTQGIETTNLNLSYSVTASTVSNLSVCTVSSSTGNCTGLVPGTLYNITVEVIVAGTSVRAVNSTQAATRPSQPGDIDLKQSVLDGNNVTIVWQISTGNVDEYSIMSPNFTKTSTVNSVNIGKLMDGRTYNVSITAVSNGVTSEPLETSFKTLVKEPDPPRGPVVQGINSGTVDLSWNLPLDPRGEKVTYQICRKSKVYNDTEYSIPYCEYSNSIFYTSANVTAGTFYSFDIRTRNEEYFSNDSLTVNLRTNETVPGNVSINNVTPVNDTLEVSWNRPSQPNGDIVSYLITWVETNSNANNRCEVYFVSNSSSPDHETRSDNPNCPNETLPVDVNEKVMEYNIMDLKAFTEYIVSIAAFTSVGKGPEVSEIQQTSVVKPEKVTDVKVDVLDSTKVNITWTIPVTNPGLVNYTIDIYDAVFNNRSDVIPCYKTDYSSADCLQTGLRPFWKYRFTVVASNDAGSTDSDQTDTITTLESEPGSVKEVYPRLYTGEPECDATRVALSWFEPDLLLRQSNITKYSIKDKNGVTSEFDVPLPQPWASNNRQFTRDLNVRAETAYEYQIHAVSMTGLMGNTTEFNFTTQSCSPPDWGTRDDITSIGVSLSSVTVTLDLTFFRDNSQGKLIDRGLIIRFYDKVNIVNIQQIGDYRNSSFFYRIDLNGLISEFQPQQQFVIGGDECLDTSKQFCNRLLPQDTLIYIQGYVCTSGYKCTLTGWFGPFKTSKEDSGGTSAGIIVAVVILLILVLAISVFGFLWYRGVIDPPGWFIKDSEAEQPLTPLVTGPSHNRPIPINRYKEVLEELHRDTNLKLSDQYEDIGKLSAEITANSTFNAAYTEANKPKNRWVNILPYDHSRVKLQLLDDDDPTSDYINANYMPGFKHQREYIASQGPLPGTVDDFWRMVWEQNVKVIVMLTQCREGNRIKCEMYWPDQLREPKQYGDIVVNPVSISALDKYNISIFQVTAYGQERQVTHLHYLDFPDFSANVEYDHFLDFVKTARGIVPHNNEGPIIVHCSAGVGRTGTFIAMDRLQLYLNSPKFSYDGQIDIFNIVLSLRENRVSMVQTESQYVLIHDCFAKMLEAKRLKDMKTDSDENLYANDGFDPYPEVLYENINGRDADMAMKTEL